MSTLQAEVLKRTELASASIGQVRRVAASGVLRVVAANQRRSGGREALNAKAISKLLMRHKAARDGGKRPVAGSG